MHTLLERLPVKALLASLLLLAVVAIGYRAQRNRHEPGPLDGTHFGFCDFHNGIYFPVVAVADRVSPYGEEYEQSYPVSRATPLFTPSIFLTHLPFAFLSMETGEWTYYALNVLMAGVIALLSIRANNIPLRWGMFLATTLMVVASRPGYGTMFAGYFTMELVIGTILAIYWGHHLTWGSLGVFLASGKPTYAIPLAILMLVRGHWRTLLIGAMINVVASVAVVVWLMPGHEWTFLLDDIRYGQSQHMADWTEMPFNSWTRVDAPSLVFKWFHMNPGELFQVVLMLVLIPLPAWLVFQLRERSQSKVFANGDSCASTKSKGSMAIGAAISILALNVTLYRNYYDLLTLMPLVVGALFASSSIWCGINELTRKAIGVFLLIALFNYGSTMMFFNRFQIETGTLPYQIATSLSGVCLVAACVIMLFGGLNCLRIDSTEG
ncbi:MAG: glycosyltransferase 87 family protein [Pirellulaceae bacterium]